MIVLWVVALLVLLAASFAFSLRTEIRLTMGVVDRARAAAAAEGAIRRAVVELNERRKSRQSQPASSWRFLFDDIQIELVTQAENARIDLNAAPAPLLEGLVESAGRSLENADPERAKAVADAILDWRDPDDRARPFGAEERAYRAAGRELGPRDQAFLSVNELGQVLGVEPELFQVLRPLVTVYSWSPKVDPMSASRHVLLAVPGMEEARVDEFIAARMAEDAGPEALSVLADAEQRRYLARGRSGIYTIAARATTAAGVTAIRRVVVKVSGNRKKPLSVLAWFEDGPEIFDNTLSPVNEELDDVPNTGELSSVQ